MVPNVGGAPGVGAGPSAAKVGCRPVAAIKVIGEAIKKLRRDFIGATFFRSGQK
jgi:hypothetical protein